MSVATSIPDTSLGLTSSEIQILRQQQQIALQGGGGHAGSVSRGRGSGRNSNSSSRATSAASSQGRLLLDPMSLRALSHQLEYLQEQIHHRIEHVCPFFLDILLGISRNWSNANLRTVRRSNASIDTKQS
jgi:hypothetical protein